MRGTGGEERGLAGIHPVWVEQSPAPLALAVEPGVLSGHELQVVENLVHLPKLVRVDYKTSISRTVFSFSH